MDAVDPLWFPTEPAAVVPVPAERLAQLRGRRVITGRPDRGWRYDLRADDPVENGGQRLVPVLVESDYYRAELDQVEVFAPLVPLEQVWVEQVEPPAGHSPPAEKEGDHQGPSRQDLLSRLVTLDAPPTRHPVPARDAPGLSGRRVVVVSPSRERRDLRAVTEPYENADGAICLRVCDEADWYRWAFTGQPAPCTEVPVYLIWVE
jgi:hypothetical protein